jgi:tetratricopeptide (TPR) repeat protein
VKPLPRRGADVTRTAAGLGAVLPAGTRVAGRYRIAGLLGVGGMGMVYRAQDERLGVEVALKVLRPDVAADAELGERFRRELVLARQVTHRNVVRIHDLGEDGGRAFLTMDFVDGRSLAQLLAEEGPLAPERAVAIARQLAEALAAAHGGGVVHRDLKPANVLVDADDRAYVSDFGVARSLTGGGLTRTGGVVGTTAYLSPEQARGEAVDGRSDLYALGLILFEMLTGASPFPGGTAEETLGQRLTGRPRTLAEAGVPAPRWLAAVVARCLERDPERRHADAGALAADLAAGRPLRRLPRPSRRALGLAAAGLAAALALAATVALLRQPATAPAAGALHSVAVLPFADETGSPELAWAARAVPEMLTAALAESAALQVADGLRVFRTVDDLGLTRDPLAAADLAQLAELLDADRLVVGRVRREAGGFRLVARLVEPGTAGAPGDDLSAAGAAAPAMADLAAQLRDRLEVPAGDPAATLRLRASPRALAAYSAGVAALSRGDAVAAAPALEEAVAADPAFAPAWLRLAAAFEALGFDDRALAAADRAVALLPAGGGRLALEARARRAVLAGDPERAQAALAAQAARFPHDLEVRIGLAEARAAAGHFAEAAADLAAVVARDVHHPRAWYLLGRYAILQGDYRRAVDEYLVRALVIQNRLGNRQGQADALNAMGMAHLNLGELDQAAPYFERAAAQRRVIGDRRGTAAVLTNLGLLEAQRGNYRPARESFEASLAIREEIGDREGVAMVTNDFGVLEEEQGSYREALAHFRRALELRRELGDERAVAESTDNVGFAYYLLGEYDNAAVYWERALDLYAGAGNRGGTVAVTQNLGLLHLARGQWEPALAAFLGTLQEARALGLPDAEAVSMANLGRVAWHQGRYAAALGSYRDALARLADIGDPRGLAEYHLFAAEARLALGQEEGAAAHLDEVRRHLAASPNREQRSALARLDAALATGGGRLAEARTALAAARADAEASGSPLPQVAAGLAEARLDLALGDPRRATAAARQAVETAASAGNAVLHLEALEVLAAARLAAGDAAGAREVLADAERLARRHAPWGGAWRLHRLRAAALAAGGDPAGAEREREAARRELARVRSGLGDDERRAFDALPEVRDLGEERTARAA